jgi:hypothetical protein
MEITGEGQLPKIKLKKPPPPYEIEPYTYHYGQHIQADIYREKPA